MCLYVCAPGAYIRLDYVSETVELLKDGSSKVLVDLLITNKSQNAVSSLLIIYPNSFLTITEDLQTVDGAGEFEDKTSTFLSKDCQENWQYQVPGAALKEKSPDPSLWQVPEGAIPLCITLSDPMNPIRDVDYYGIVQGRNTLSYVEGLDPLSWLILSLAKYTAFSCSFSAPLQPQIPRFVRWYFHAPTATLNPTRGWRKILRQALNNLYFIYEITGPYNVKKGLNTYLKATLLTGAHKVKGSYSSEIIHRSRAAASQLIDILFTRGASLEGTWTNADDWRIHINPRGVGGRITDIVTEGHIFVSGALPNMVLDGNTRMPYYEWKTGHRMMPPPEPSDIPAREREYWFSINFQAKRLAYIVLILPWVALGVSVFNLVRGCLDSAKTP